MTVSKEWIPEGLTLGLLNTERQGLPLRLLTLRQGHRWGAGTGLGTGGGGGGGLSNIPGSRSGACDDQKRLQTSPRTLGEQSHPTENNCTKEASEFFEVRLFHHPRNGSRISRAVSLI